MLRVVVLLIFLINLEIIASENSNCGEFFFGETKLKSSEKQASVKSMFPWTVLIEKKSFLKLNLVGIFKNQYAPAYLTTGTLISHKMVLTSAVNMFFDKEQLREYNILMHFGVTQVGRNDGVTHDGASKIKPHPNFKESMPKVNNVALILLKYVVIFNNFSRPICYSGLFEIKNFIGKEAYAAGWSYNKKSHNYSTKMYTALTLKANCKETNHSGGNNYFCACGPTDHEEICRGYGPLYYKIGDKWHIIGLLSTLEWPKGSLCRPKSIGQMSESIRNSVEWITESIRRQDFEV